MKTISGNRNKRYTDIKFYDLEESKTLFPFLDRLSSLIVVIVLLPVVDTLVYSFVLNNVHTEGIR
jgi:hypothetical protein